MKVEKAEQYTLQMNKMGHVTLVRLSDGKSVYFQLESDTDIVRDNLTKSQKKDLDNGWPVELDASTPQGAFFAEYFEER